MTTRRREWPRNLGSTESKDPAWRAGQKVRLASAGACEARWGERSIDPTYSQPGGVTMDGEALANGTAKGAAGRGSETMRFAVRCRKFTRQHPGIEKGRRRGKETGAEEAKGRTFTSSMRGVGGGGYCCMWDYTGGQIAVRRTADLWPGPAGYRTCLACQAMQQGRQCTADADNGGSAAQRQRQRKHSASNQGVHPTLPALRDAHAPPFSGPVRPTSADRPKA